VDSSKELTNKENAISMAHRSIASRGTIVAILILQIIPLVLFPLQSFSTDSQEWWLPVLLAIMVVIADLQLILRRSTQLWPWHLFSFAHGFNIISRLMMLWSHATRYVNGVMGINVPYLTLTCLAMAFSAILLWYLELPDVRIGLIR
jgi:hypothetical protein